MQHCISDSIYRLTLAWISSETSTKQLECRLILTRSSFTGRWTLSHADWPLCSGVDCPYPCPVANCLLELFFQLTLFSRPLPLPVTARFQVQNPLSGFAPKQTKESSAWRATYIVLQLGRGLTLLQRCSRYIPQPQFKLFLRIGLVWFLCLTAYQPL